MLAELAVALRGLGKHAEAERCCKAAVGARPDYQRGWLELGRAQAAQGEATTFTTDLYHCDICPSFEANPAHLPVAAGHLRLQARKSDES